MNNFPYIDILILAMIAIFIINRLRNVLGKKTGNESDIVEKFTQKKSGFKESTPDNVTKDKDIGSNIVDKKHHKDPKINKSINEILKIDPDFDTKSFCSGAKKAFEFILSEYCNDNMKSLEKLVSKNILASFSTQIKERGKKSEKLEITVISVKDPIIKDIRMQKNKATIKLFFDSEQVQLTRNKNNEVVDGDSNQILSITENWTFSKDMKSKDPNWTLEEIEESS